MRNPFPTIETIAGALFDAGVNPALVPNRFGRAVMATMAALKAAAPR